MKNKNWDWPSSQAWQ